MSVAPSNGVLSAELIKTFFGQKSLVLSVKKCPRHCKSRALFQNGWTILSSFVLPVRPGARKAGQNEDCHRQKLVSIQSALARTGSAGHSSDGQSWRIEMPKSELSGSMLDYNQIYSFVQ
jgi:hypothetical protein